MLNMNCTATKGKNPRWKSRQFVSTCMSNGMSHETHDTIVKALHNRQTALDYSEGGLFCWIFPCMPLRSVIMLSCDFLTQTVCLFSWKLKKNSFSI